MITRAELEAREAAQLAPYAILSGQHRGREHLEEESRTRTAFQKDRDRILHTTAFRRLEAKTQVFLNAQQDHYRTRLTHTLEVQQVARSVALTLGLNEMLAEAVALAHDLGHPPFGHAGERVLNTLMAEHGGFDHNQQAQRIVTVLEDRYTAFPGLNLTLDTLDGLNKHRRAGLGWPSLEAQVVDAADALAYTAHDLDDGLRSGIITPVQLQALPLGAALLERAELKVPHLTDAQRRILHRKLLGWLISDLRKATAQSIRQSAVQSPAQVAEQPQRLVTYSPELRQFLRETGDFLTEHLYRHWRIERQVEQATRILSTLFQAFMQRPRMLPEHPQARLSEDPLPRVICDYLAGMTDRYALEMYQQISPG